MYSYAEQVTYLGWVQNMAQLDIWLCFTFGWFGDWVGMC